MFFYGTALCEGVTVASGTFGNAQKQMTDTFCKMSLNSSEAVSHVLAIPIIGHTALLTVIRHLLRRLYLQQHRVRVRVRTGFLVPGRVRIEIRGRDGVSFNVSIYHWSNCRRSKCRPFLLTSLMGPWQ